MASKEYYSGPEVEPTVPLEDLLKDHKDQSIKRASRLLNPLDDHPFLSTVDTTSRKLLSDEGIGFNRQTGIKDAKSLVKREIRHPGNALKISNTLAQRGYQLLEDVIATPARLENGIYKMDDQRKGLFDNMQQHTPNSRFISDPVIVSSLGLVNRVIREELFRNEGFSSEEQKILLAAVIGFAQSVAVERSSDFIYSDGVGEEVKDKNKESRLRKNLVRDQVLGYAFRVLGAEGQQGIVGYFMAQKEYQAEESSKKRNKK